MAKRKPAGQYESMLRELLDLESGLSKWEMDFLDNISSITRGPVRLFDHLSDKQVEFIEKIWNQKIGEQNGRINSSGGGSDGD